MKTSEAPFFSIVIPTYNRKPKLERAVKSVLSQSFENYELIIVDDGSTDDTADFLFSLTDSRVKYFYQENSGLPSIGRNNGVGKSKGVWICFLDSDDWWEENKLEVIHKFIQNNNSIEIVSHFENLVNQQGNILSVLRHMPKQDLPYFDELINYGSFLSPSAIAIKRGVFINEGGFNTSVDYYSVEDLELWLRLAKKYKFGFVKEILGSYLVDGNGISSNILRHTDAQRNIYLKYWRVPFWKRFGFPMENLINSRVNRTRGRYFQLNGEVSNAIKYTSISLINYPFNIKSLGVLVLSLLLILKKKLNLFNNIFL